MKAELLDRQEKEEHGEKIHEKVEAEVQKLVVQQKVQTETQMKRIARDRNEQITQKKRDGRKLMKRNKNEVSDLMEKQNYEIKTIVSFMKFSLGKRAPKEEEKEATFSDLEVDKVVQMYSHPYKEAKTTPHPKSSLTVLQLTRQQ